MDFQFLGRSFVALLNAYVLLNIGLGFFNLLVPAIPMDGGRLLRSILATQMPFPEATRKAVSVSKLLAVILGLIGFADNFWLVIIAIFIYISSSSELEESLTRYLLEDVSLRSVPKDEISSVDPTISVAQLIDKMLEEGETGYLVGDLGNFQGYVNLAGVSMVDKEDRQDVSVEDIMVSEIPTIGANSSAKSALRLFQENETDRVYIRDGTELSGMLTQKELFNFVKVKSIEKVATKNSVKRGCQMAEVTST